jgi:radical SAM protein with 4Fe4S-binding SPASM domain
LLHDILSRFTYRTAIARMKFRKTYIEICTCCNRACDFCPGTDREKKIMDVELFRTIMKKLQGYSHLLHFHVMGEPLMHPKIDDFLDLCLQYNYRVNLVTNGILLDKKSASILTKKALRQISISMHHISGMAAGKKIDGYLTEIKNFTEQAGIKNSGLYISMRLWNAGDIDIRNYMRTKIFKMFNISPAITKASDKNKPVRLGRNIWLNSAEKFEWPDIHNTDYGRQGTCLGLKDQIAILCDGTVVPCCLDNNGTMALGSIGSSSIDDILNSPRASAIKNGFTRGEITEDLCRHCSFRLRFKKHAGTDQETFLP